MSVSNKVKYWVRKRPYIQESMAEEIVNYSALARKVQEDVEGSFQAIKMALMRYSDEVKSRKKKKRSSVSDILEGTVIQLESCIRVCKSKSRESGKVLAKTEHGYTIFQNSGEECNGECIKGQAMITLKSPEKLETTPGVISHILSFLEARGINVTEFISCREDTHIVISEKDVAEAFRLINEIL